MIFNKQKVHMDNTERRIYKREIERLVKERNNFANKYETANKYKKEYEQLVKDYKKKIKELDTLKQETNKLKESLEFFINKQKK